MVKLVRGVLSVVVAVACLAPTVAHGQEEGAEVQADTKLELGLRTGYAIPLGKAAGDADDDMNDIIAGQVPLWIDIGARIRQQIFVGAYFSYGFGILSGDFSDLCDEADEEAAALGASISCSTSDMRFGAQAIYHFGTPDEMHFWLGGGIGYEWWRISQTAELGSQRQTIGITGHGFEFLNVQLGGDFPVAKGFAVGPFFAFTLAQFGTVSASCSGDGCPDDPDSEDIDDKALHNWLFFGVRVVAVP